MNATVSYDHPMKDAHGSSTIGPTAFAYGGPPPLSILHRMPVETLAGVCKSLDPIWLMKLTATCSRLRDNLSFPLGNKIWYDALPKSLWTEQEKYQDEYELAAAKAAAISTYALIMGNVRTSSNEAMSSCQITLSSTQQLSGFQPISTISGPESRSCNLLPINPTLATISRIGHSHALLTRNKVRALGGSYNAHFNYKREIIGQLSTHRRCYICATTVCSDGRSVKPRCFGLILCNDCLKCYSISIAQFERFVALRVPLQHVTIFPFREGEKRLFYLPNIDNMLRANTGADLSAHIYSYYDGRQQLEKKRYERSSLEMKRRTVRHRLVDAARQLWEGIDPVSKKIVDPVTGAIISVPLRNAPTIQTFKVFRSRFAPTRILQEFLFSPWTLNEHPTTLPYDKANGWLPDPSMSLKEAQCDVVTDKWVAFKAYDMLTALTRWNSGSYNRKGAGGYVDSWVVAAKKYHLARLENLLEAGVTIAMNDVPGNGYAEQTPTGILECRVKAGLQQDTTSTTMVPLPPCPDRAGQLVGQSFAEHKIRDEITAKAELERKKGIKVFNKLIRHCCAACPVARHAVHPRGFEGLVEHMRSIHPQLFWESDEWNTVG